MDCTCKGFYKPADCPTHGNKEQKDKWIKRGINGMTLTVQALEDDSVVRKKLIEAGYGNQCIDECKELLMELILELEDK